MEAFVRITADTQDEAQAALDELCAAFQDRLIVLQPVQRERDGDWVAAARLEGQLDWVGYNRTQQSVLKGFLTPDQAVKELDTHLGAELNSSDYLSEYGFDVVGTLMRAALLVYAEDAERAELHIHNAAGTIKIWQADAGWIVSYPVAGQIVQRRTEKGELVGTLYKALQVLVG